MSRSILASLLFALLLFPSLSVHSLPTGVMSYSGPILTREVLGYANITSLLAYNATSEHPYGASLQLNVVLVANTSGGKAYYFWLQNVAEFITDKRVVYFLDNVWNVTTPMAGICNVSGRGQISPIIRIFYHSNAYGFESGQMYYAFPFAFYLLISEGYNSSGVEVNFTYVILQDGYAVQRPEPVTYDTVFIPIHNLQSAYIVVNNSTTPNCTMGSRILSITLEGDTLDAELVWGGLSNGESTSFLNMSSYLGLYYLSGDRFVPFSTVYDYGLDTQESTNDLQVTLAKNGYAYVTVGTPDYGLLSDNFSPPPPEFPPVSGYVAVVIPTPYLVVYFAVVMLITVLVSTLGIRDRL